MQTLERIAGRLGLMLCSRSLLRTVLELIGRNPGMLLAVRFDVWNRFRRCTIWPSFVYHSRLTICDCLRFTKVCFCPYTSEK
jgi:hypothetical protein